MNPTLDAYTTRYDLAYAGAVDLSACVLRIRIGIRAERLRLTRLPADAVERTYGEMDAYADVMRGRGWLMAGPLGWQV